MYSTSIRAGIYCRISQDPSGTALGVERQRQDCEKLAAAKGWEVAGIYIDNDVSAYSGKPRPEYRRLLADIRDGAINALAVWHLDRLHRRPIELEEFMQLCDDHHVELATVHGDINLGTSSGRLQARLMGAVARHESEHKSERIKRALFELAKSGHPYVFGRRAIGYSDDGMTIVPEEAQMIRDGVARILAGESLRSFCLDLNRKGIRTSLGNTWTQFTVKKTLTNPRYAGLRQRADLGLIKGQWPAIISEQDWKRVTAILSDPARRTNVGAPRRHLLSGILHCGECGRGLISHGTNRSYGRCRIYTCRQQPGGCSRVSITARWVEEFVTGAIFEAFENLPLSVTNDNRADAVALDEIESDRLQLQELAVMFGERKITSEEWRSAKAPVEARINAAQATVVEGSRTTLIRRLKEDGTNLYQLWPSLDSEKQRAIIESVIDHVVVKRVGKGRHKDASRLQVVLKY